MSENILYKLAKDLSQLYAKTKIKSIENCFIKIAQALDSEVKDWLSKAVKLGYKSSLKNPFVLDALIQLTHLKESTPGITAAIFVKMVMEEDKNGKPNPLKQFLPVFISFREIANSTGSAILSPYKSVLDATSNMSNGANTASIAQDIKTLDNMFRSELDKKINSPFEDDMLNSKKKMTKKEKLGNLSHYLKRRFSEEISLAYEKIGELDTVGFTNEPSLLGDPAQIATKMFPTYRSKASLDILGERAIKIAKDILNLPDLQDYDYVYNYLKNRVMLSASIIDKDQVTDFEYKHGLGSNTGEEKPSETNGIEVEPQSWTVSHPVILLSMVLYILGTKSR